MEEIDKILDNIELWAENKITEFANENPRIAVASVYMKRGVKNLIAKEKENINNFANNALLFIADGDVINFESLRNDIIGILDAMEERPFSFRFLKGTVGKGAIRIQLPNNFVTEILFGDLSCIKITDEDIKDLFDTKCYMYNI